jgi:N-acetylmuramoyl-L-alanine amidase
MLLMKVYNVKFNKKPITKGVTFLLVSILALSAALFASCSENKAVSASPSPIISSTITPVPPKSLSEPSAVSTPSASKTAAPSPSKPEKLPLSGFVIGLDPGHQSTPDREKEPNSPGSKDMKDKCSKGTEGIASGVSEYKVNLQVALELRDKLKALGAKVIMTREKNDVSLSNVQRAEMMNKAKVDCWFRIHSNGTPDRSVYGMEMLVPSKGCLDTDDKSVYDSSVRLGSLLLKAAIHSTDAKDLGLKPRSDQTGFNWSKRPVCNIEMGFMTNKEEDLLLTYGEYQDKIVSGLVQGFLDYFTE